MSFTVKIKGDSPKAQSIIELMRELAKDYSFLTITEDDLDNNAEILQEVDARKEYMKNHPDEWRSWEEIKNELQNK
ncbi:MAG: hypothetical protein ACK5M7_08960 [Draconibacterium sp.]